MKLDFRTAAGWLLAALVCIAPVKAAEYGVAARVNGAEISAARLEGRFQEYLAEQGRSVQRMTHPSAFKRLKREALEQLIDRELLWQEAKKRGAVAKDAAVDEAMERFRAEYPDERHMRFHLQEHRFTPETYREYVRQELSIRLYLDDAVLSSVTLSDDEIHQFYVDNPDKFTRPEQVRARHILIQLPPTAKDEEKAAARRQIEALRARAQAGEDFAGLARAHSDDSTAAAGGDLGFFTRDQMVKPFADAAFALKAGEVSPVVETTFGLHLIKLEERRDSGLVPEAEVREPLRQHLATVKAQRALQEKVAALRAGAKIEVLMPL